MTATHDHAALDYTLSAIARDASRRHERISVVLRLRSHVQGSAMGDRAADFTRRIQPVINRLALLQVEVVGVLWIASAIAARMPAGMLLLAAQDPDILHIFSDHSRPAT